jgi:putative ATPase
MEVEAGDDVLRAIAVYCDGDARTAYNVLEATVNDCASEGGRITLTVKAVSEVTGRKNLMYDRDGEYHYDLISALHKSMRNSDPDAAVYWLARMLAGGEDPLYIARRLIEFAGDDVGMADPQAQMMAVSCFEACHYMGMPDCRFALAETVIYLSLAPRSNAVAVAIDAALEDASKMLAEQVPLHLRNAPTKMMKDLGYAKDYQYAEDADEKVLGIELLMRNQTGRDFEVTPQMASAVAVIRVRVPMESLTAKSRARK